MLVISITLNEVFLNVRILYFICHAKSVSNVDLEIMEVLITVHLNNHSMLSTI